VSERSDAQSSKIMWEIVRVARGAPEADELAQIARTAFAGPWFSPIDELEKPWARVWAARDKLASRAVGFLVSWHVVDEFHVLHVATAEDVRRQGVGHALVAEALAYARANDVRLCLLEVRRSNHPAIRLYEKVGFVVENVRPKYYADNDEDALEMWLMLKP
jgi:ribosomal-protein-alanine N-acetyltransferase